MKNVNTPYDDTFRTLQYDCPELIIPMVNEIFHEDYNGDEEITFAPNELYFQISDGEMEERITDSTFTITKQRNGIRQKRRYHMECQSRPDGSIALRIVEYDMLVAARNGEKTPEGVVVRFPESAVLYLRHTKNTPDKLTIRLETPGGNVSYEVPVVKVQNYGIEKIFEKRLLFLIPFYIFGYEHEFEKIMDHEEKLQKLKEEYAMIRRRLDELCEVGEIDTYIKQTIVTMTGTVVSNLARKYEKIAKGVKDNMGGNVLEYEAKDILRQGRAEGRQIGDLERLFQSVEQVMKNLSVELAEACRILGITPEEYEKAKAEILIAMLESGMSVEEISEIVKKPINEVKRLIEEFG